MKTPHRLISPTAASAFFLIPQILFPLFLLFSPLAAKDEGRLSGFQEGLRHPSKETDPRPSREATVGEEALAETLSTLMGGLFVSGTFNSLALVAPESGPDRPLMSQPRAPGEAVLPYIEGEFQYQWVDGDTDALDFRLTGGYGPAGASVRWTRFRETEPDTRLDVLQAYGHLRLTLGNFLEFSPGLGYGNFSLGDDAEDEGGLALTLPLRVHFQPGIGLEYRPAWVFPNGTTVSDQEVALVLGRRNAFLRLGYRWLWNESETLSGPYLGVSLRW
ncbi:hypothetical protein [Puniceicoccus vermicola]|uniref:Uncharacterized protein n=1 Tax=Puniceicoccus vermicola TaxID=388746 RepID=A0A7X1AZQ8_9BACT|nr:hypothetical protein [Puniceicoccus vermicola]MBC2602978.1 hypothetical protein [Puniceicoccus vermicola]